MLLVLMTDLSNAYTEKLVIFATEELKMVQQQFSPRKYWKRH